MELEVINGSFAYPSGKVLFKDINFILPQGTMMTVLGRNGVGKTTLLKCMMGILKWRSGTLRLDGEDVGSALHAREISYVPQAHGITFSYTIHEVVTMGRARFMGPLSIPSKYDHERADAALEQVGLADLRDRPCTKLSGGQLQLVYIARAIAADPEIIILDEPESHLDFNNQYFILELLDDLVHKQELSAIINTHYPDHALKLSDKSLMLGPDGYCFGDTKEILTEDNIREYFNVSAIIEELQRGGRDIPLFTVTGRV